MIWIICIVPKRRHSLEYFKQIFTAQAYYFTLCWMLYDICSLLAMLYSHMTLLIFYFVVCHTNFMKTISNDFQEGMHLHIKNW